MRGTWEEDDDVDDDADVDVEGEDDDVEEEDDDVQEEDVEEEDRSHYPEAHFARACAVEIQTDIAQNPLCVENYRKNGRRHLWVSEASGIFPANFRTKCLLWPVHVHFDCAGSHKTMSPEVSPVLFPVNFHTKWLLYFVHAHFDCTGTGP